MSTGNTHRTVCITFTKLLTFALAHGKNIPIEKIPKREPAVMPARLFPACGNKYDLNNS
jgi:hypothetical protein